MRAAKVERLVPRRFFAVRQKKRVRDNALHQNRAGRWRSESAATFSGHGHSHGLLLEDRRLKRELWPLEVSLGA